MTPFRRFERAEVEQSIVSRFRAQVAVHADRPAIGLDDGAVSYAELAARSERLARTLVARLGHGRGAVGFVLPQGASAVVATLGILESGRPYVPIDPDGSVERMRAIRSHARIDLVLTESARAAAVSAALPEADVVCIDAPGADGRDSTLEIEIEPDRPAYVYYTSGSTGPPKGVLDSHRNVLHNVLRYTNALGIRPEDRLSLIQPCGFSATVSSLFGALLNGACVCPLDLAAGMQASLADWIERQRITIFHSVPSIFRWLLETGRSHPSVRVVRLEGDAATRADVERFRGRFAPRSRLAHGLGTTETGLVCQWIVEAGTALPHGPVPVGRAVEGMEVLVVDEHGTPLAEGATGEVVVRSEFLALGYLGDEERTARAFDPPRPGSPHRTYRTGDLGRLGADGCLVHLGRLDARTRVRGKWVDLAEVEAALSAVDGLRESAVTVREDDTGARRIVAHVVPVELPGPTTTALRRRLGETLAPHMIPSAFVTVDRLPLDRHGKLDRAALPEPRHERPVLAADPVSPRNLLQLQLALLWEELLAVRPIGVRDDFFDLGGDSLLALRLLAAIDERFGRKLAASELLAGPTIERIADALVRGERAVARPIVELNASGRRMPFFFLHGDYLSGGFYCRDLARHVGPDQPLHVIAPLGLDGAAVPPSYEAMAVGHLDALRRVAPHGPYRLGGVCNGGLVAYEMARSLEASGETVERLVLVGASAANVRFRTLREIVERAGRAIATPPGTRTYVFLRLRDFLARREGASAARLLSDAARGALRLPALLREDRSLAPGDWNPAGYRERLWEIYQRLDRAHVPGPRRGRLILIWPGNDPTPAESAAADWRRLGADVVLRVVPGTHTTSLTRHADELGRVLHDCLGDDRSRR